VLNGTYIFNYSSQREPIDPGQYTVYCLIRDENSTEAPLLITGVSQRQYIAYVSELIMI